MKIKKKKEKRKKKKEKEKEKRHPLFAGKKKDTHYLKAKNTD